MSLEHPEQPATFQDIPPIQTPVAAAPITFMSAPLNNRATMPDTGLTNLPTTIIEQANGISKSPTEDATAQPPSAPAIDGARLSGSELDDPTAVNTSPLRDVDPQIVEALRGKDRIYVLKLGELMEGLINDERRQRIELAPASTYQRLLVHRCSAYYKLAPETEPVSKAIYVCSTAESRIPSCRISELVPPEPTAAPAFKIMRRSSTDRRNKPPHQAGSVTGEDGDLSDLEPSETGSLGGRSNTTGGSTKKHMTIEEREAAYNEARSRIFMGFEGKEKAKEKDINSSSSSLSAASGSTKNGGSSAGDADSSSSSPATESEWSGPARRERPQHSGYASASSSTRSIRSSAYISNGSGSSRNSRAASPSSFQFPSLYEPTPQMTLFDPSQHSAPAAPVYHPPYGYPYNQGQPNPPYVPYHAYYPAPYPQYSSPSHHPQNVSDPSTPSSGEPYQPPPPPMPYGAPYMWSHPNQPPVQSPPMQPQPIPSQPPSNIPHAMSSPPPGQPPYQPYMPPPPPHAYPYPMPGYYPNQPGHPMPPPPPAHPPHMPAPQLYDPRTSNNGVGNNQANGFRNGLPGNGVPPPNNGRPPLRNGFNGPNNGNGPKPRNGAVQPGRAPWSYGPGIGSGGFVATGPQPNETAVGPRLSNNNRRQSNMSSSSMNGRSTSGDDVSSVASSASSSTRRAQTISAGSQHPLPPRPDWAINLKPHNSRNISPISPPRSISGSSVQSNYSSRHSSHPNPPIPLQSNDFPPLTATQPSEKRMPTGAWGNPSSRPIFGQANNGINSEMGNRFDETGFERPPPKSVELYNPKTPKRTSLNAANAEHSRVQGDTDKANGDVMDLTEQVTALSLENDASTAEGSTSPPSSTSVYMASSR